ncbi:probable ATP-dependent RNA helicase ddx5 [Triticum dicoccoides]|uniref:probable ATP-dependent RNA helicase ddx5 n=1 Tax=Triticum dicoccoides TaxID=85692 RepID=UPI0018906CF5|nr:probable ATP-dependent RNA helicase ddx5 [Triticum dicoccoides]
MPKGDDALARKRGKVRRKRMRSSENAVSTRVAAIIASKRRRKTGKRRGCEGMCFSLPCPEDPFNERHGKKRKTEDAADTNDDHEKKKSKDSKKRPLERATGCNAIPVRKKETVEDRVEYDRPSKFLVVCLNAIRDGAGASEEDGGGIHDTASWGMELWKSCAASPPSDVLDTSYQYATREQTAWLVSTACDIVARKEKLGVVVSCPFLLYLVPSQEKAVQVRSICKPLKSLGIHSVSLHPGASIEHQISGLKSCEPEFLISTPERLLELVSLKAIDISNVSMLVIDGLKYFMDLNIIKELRSIRGTISGDAQVTIFSGQCDQSAATVARNLLHGRITKLTTNDSVTSRSAFVAQHVHFCTKEEKTSKVKEILENVLENHASKTAKVLLVAVNDHEAQKLSSSLKLEILTVNDGSQGSTFTVCSSMGLINVLVKGCESLATSGVEEFEIVLVADLPPSFDDYVEILTRTARHTVAGEVHVIVSKTDAAHAKPLADVLANSGQAVPKLLRQLIDKNHS